MRSKFSRCATILLLLSATVCVAHADSSSETRFTRIDANGPNDPRALQVAIVSYTSDGMFDDTRIDLVSAVHVGDESYYAELNRRFENYDALLYELVAPKGTVVQPGQTSKSAVSSLQLAMRKILSLSFQLDEIDYTRSNFVHADLSPEEMRASMQENGESAYSLFWKLFAASFREALRDPLGIEAMIQFGSVLNTGKDHPMKIMLAYEFSDISRHTALLEDASSSTLIGARNERAIDVMLDELEAGKKRVAIFYGAAHMPDFEARLHELGFIAVETQWVDAWVL